MCGKAAESKVRRGENVRTVFQSLLDEQMQQCEFLRGHLHDQNMLHSRIMMLFFYVDLRDTRK